MTEAEAAPHAGPCALIMAGGTGGHIFPALAVARALRDLGWQVQWLGTGRGMEARIVPEHGFALHTMDFSGVRGKGLGAWAGLPWRLLRALLQARAVLRRTRADVVLGFGGYASVPGALVARLHGKPLLLHEQNAVAGSANRLLARFAHQVFTAFPGVLPGGTHIGNPLRRDFLTRPPPAQRFAARMDAGGPLRLLVMGGSQGAQILNETVPAALALLPPQKRPQVLHQSGAAHAQALRQRYASLQVEAEVCAFIGETATEMARADLIICRAGASTVCELAAVGAAAIYVPFAAAVDDHQTRNAQHVVAAGGGWLLAQQDCTPQRLAAMVDNIDRPALLAAACHAKTMQKHRATEEIVAACQRFPGPGKP